MTLYRLRATRLLLFLQEDVLELTSAAEEVAGVAMIVDEELVAVTSVVGAAATTLEEATELVATAEELARVETAAEVAAATAPADAVVDPGVQVDSQLAQAAPALFVEPPETTVGPGASYVVMLW